MTTQTQQTTTPTAPEQGTHHWILTVDLPGRTSLTANGTWTPPAGWTRSDVFNAIKQDMAQRHPELATANVVFFSLEPNQL